MSINFIPNDPRAGSAAPAMRVQTKRPNRPSSRAGFTFSNPATEGTFEPGTPEFLFWQCREAGLASLETWESFAGVFKRWQGNRKRLQLLQDNGVDINAFYDRESFAFFHRQIGDATFFSGASTDVVAHEVGHGLLDTIRPDLWDAPFLETGAFHEAFGDCIAVLTALNDKETRERLLSVTSTLRAKNFVESTAEDLSEGIRRLAPSHNASEPRHAHNTFQFQIPETLPASGGPGALVNEVHSFGMLFSGCFYDLIANIFAAQATASEANLLTAAQAAGKLLVGGATGAIITPRFFQAVGRAMVLADEAAGSQHRDKIRDAFQRHNIQLGANTLLAPVAVLSGAAPTGRAAAVGAATRKDLLVRLGASRGAKLSGRATELSGQRFAQLVHTQRVALGSVDKRLKGVTVDAPVSILVGNSGGRAALMGQMPELVSTEREVEAFVKALIANGQVELGGGPKAAAATGRRRGAVGGADARQPVRRETHRVKSVAGRKTLERVRFSCKCGG